MLERVWRVANLSSYTIDGNINWDSQYENSIDVP